MRLITADGLMVLVDSRWKFVSCHRKTAGGAAPGSWLQLADQHQSDEQTASGPQVATSGTRWQTSASLMMACLWGNI